MFDYSLSEKVQRYQPEEATGKFCFSLFCKRNFRRPFLRLTFRPLIYKNTSVRFCSMPKLSYEKIEERKTGIEDAAKELLIKQGFHATSMRDIARRADISLGNVYNYFETKEAIFESIINRYLVVIDPRIKEILEELDEPLDPQDMRRLGEMIGEMVDQHQDFWLLMYIDVLEFQNRHFRKMFGGLAEKFRRLFEEKFASAIRRGDLRSGVDPAIGFTVAYMQFFNYFLVEKLFGGNLHLGLTDDQALNYLTKIFSYGVLSEGKLAQFKKTTIKKAKTAK